MKKDKQCGFVKLGDIKFFAPNGRCARIYNLGLIVGVVVAVGAILDGAEPVRTVYAQASTNTRRLPNGSTTSACITLSLQLVFLRAGLGNGLAFCSSRWW